MDRNSNNSNEALVPIDDKSKSAAANASQYRSKLLKGAQQPASSALPGFNLTSGGKLTQISNTLG